MARRTPYRLSRTDAGHLWFAVELRGGWSACYRLIPRDGRPVLAELKVVPTPPVVVVNIDKAGEPHGHHEPPGDGLTAGLVRDEVVIGQHVYELLPRALRNAQRGRLGQTILRVGGRPASLFEAFLSGLGFDATAPPKRGRRGPKPTADRHYAELAAEYVEACASGSRRPVAHVAERRGMSGDALRQALRRARRRALLTRQTVGRAGGELTPRAKKLLKKET